MSNLNQSASVVSCDGTASRDTCEVTCSSGYHPSNATILCLLGEFVVGGKSCLENACDTVPESMPHINMTASAEPCVGTASQDTCSYICDNGYEPSGGSVTCVRGEWNLNGASCVLKPCRAEPTVLHYTGSGCVNTASNATCNVNCDQGWHQVNGPASCYAGEWTEPLPTCEEDSCPSVRHCEYFFRFFQRFHHIFFSIKIQVPPNIQNMNVTASSSCSNLSSQSTCDIECDEGYTASNPTMTCVRGEWFGSATCEPNPCLDDLPLINQMDRTASRVTCNNTASDSTCEISCENGYTPSGSLECSLGYWVESTMPTCDMDCSSNPPIRFLNNTATMCQNVSSGSTCNVVTCLTSPSAYYSYNSHVAVTCYNGTYVTSVSNSVSDDFSTYASVDTYESTVNLICVPDPCDSEPLIANYTGSGCADTASNATCNVNCDQGYHQVNGPATCYAGVWTEPLPTCEEDSCQSPPNEILFLNHTASSLNCSNTTSRSSCDIVCDDRYTVSNPTMTCIRGEWTGNASCAAESCAGLPPIEHMDENLSISCASTESGSSCNVTCLDGFTASLSTRIDTTYVEAHCQKGVWSGSQESFDLPAYDILRVGEFCSSTSLLGYYGSLEECADGAVARNKQVFSYDGYQCYTSDTACTSWSPSSGFTSYATYVVFKRETFDHIPQIL